MEIDLTEIVTEVKTSFMKLGDTLEILPTYGRKQKVKLNRTRVSIEVASGHTTRIDTLRFQLASPRKTTKSYELILEDDFYYLKSTCGHPFRINGQYCFSAILQHNDCIYLDYNKIQCRKFSEKKTEEHELLVGGNLNVLIEGETGVGKSHMARDLHQRSGRVGDFIHLNLASFPPSLIESELFGHVKGAFTGAVAHKDGALLASKGGTLFLDEIDSLPLSLQVKLLLFLDDYSFRPVGSITEVKCQTSIIFAAGQSLKNLMEAGDFRKDLFYRITSGFKIEIKPLRDDKARIDMICDNYELKHEVLIDFKLRKLFHSLPWPGNIRQLIGVLDRKRVSVKRGNRLGIDDDDFELCGVSEITDGELIKFKELKVRYFRRAYFSNDCNIKLAARRIGVSQGTMYKFIHSA